MGWRRAASARSSRIEPTRSGLRRLPDVSRFQNGRFTTLTAANGPFEGIVPSIVDDDDGNVWVGVNAGSGLVRFSPREMDKVAVDRAHQIEYSLYDVSDGLQGDLHWLSRPAAVRAGDGRLWFATGVGVAIIDPRNLPRSRRPATPRIELASADGQTLAPVDQLVLARTSTLRIDYAALSLSAASKLRFRYSLLGLNNDWVPAGTHREVSYKNLPPGRYRFRVSATNDGLWTDAAVWEFSVAPPFFRTTWFIAFCAIGVACLLILGVVAAAAGGQDAFALVFAERTRVSRDIHDTLLQSLGAIGLELEAIASQLDTSPGSASESLRRLRRQVTHSVREAREWIWELRSTRMEPRGGLVDDASTVGRDGDGREGGSRGGCRRRPLANVPDRRGGAAASHRSGGGEQRAAPRLGRVRFASRSNIGPTPWSCGWPTTGAASSPPIWRRCPPASTGAW